MQSEVTHCDHDRNLKLDLSLADRPPIATFMPKSEPVFETRTVGSEAGWIRTTDIHFRRVAFCPLNYSLLVPHW